MNQKILLADDSPTIHKIMGLTLKPEGYEIDLAHSKEELLEKIASEQYGALILDATLGDEASLPIVTHIRNKGMTSQDLPILMLYGSFDQFNPQNAISAGAQGALEKPFQAESLLKILNSLISGELGEIQRLEEEPSPYTPEEATAEMLPNEPSFQLGDEFNDWEVTPSPLGEDPPLEEFELQFQSEREEPQTVSLPEEEITTTELSLEDSLEEWAPPEPKSETSQFKLPDIELTNTTRQSPVGGFKLPNQTRPLEPSSRRASHPLDSKPTPEPAPIDQEEINEMVKKTVQATIEKIAWEVIPDLAEKIIKEEIQRILAEEQP